MARNKGNADVETVEQDEVETVAEQTEEKQPKAKKEPARGELPEGYVTPIGFAKILGERGLQRNRGGEVVTDVRPQMVYSYIKNAPKDDAFPLETITDSIGKERQVVNVEAGVEWWERKNERTATRKQNAADKATKKAERAAAKAAEAEASDEAEAAEAE